MQKLFRGLRKTKERLFGSIQGIFSSDSLDADTLDELEGVLLSADLGPEATERIIARLRAQGAP
jgi:fused signal recognition particle receptor